MKVRGRMEGGEAGCDAPPPGTSGTWRVRPLSGSGLVRFRRGGGMRLRHK